jgi:hypothetical protein
MTAWLPGGGRLEQREQRVMAGDGLRVYALLGLSTACKLAASL